MRRGKMRRRGRGEEEEEEERRRRCCGGAAGVLQEGSLLTPQRPQRHHRDFQTINSSRRERGMECKNGGRNGGRRRRQVAGQQWLRGATRGDPPALPGGAPGRRGGALPPAHAEHAGISRYGDRVLGAVMALESDVLQFFNLV